MKILAHILTFSLIFIGCNKDDKNDDNPSTTTFDNHSSALMGMMHAMSDSMSAMQLTGDPDHDFAMMMSMHHQGAIIMADYELANGNDNTIRSLAESMKEMQMMEVQTLDSFISAHTPMPFVNDFDSVSMAAMDLMHSNSDVQKLNGDSDHDFAHLMLTHHQSAMQMAQAEIENGQDAMLIEMAHHMMEMQQMEMNSLQIWLNSNN